MNPHVRLPYGVPPPPMSVPPQPVSVPTGHITQPEGKLVQNDSILKNKSQNSVSSPPLQVKSIETQSFYGTQKDSLTDALPGGGSGTHLQPEQVDQQVSNVHTSSLNVTGRCPENTLNTAELLSTQGSASDKFAPVNSGVPVGQDLSVEERRAMNSKYSGYLRTRIASLSDSIDARLKCLQ